MSESICLNKSQKYTSITSAKLPLKKINKTTLFYHTGFNENMINDMQNGIK